jgi:hypothetical protein
MAAIERCRTAALGGHVARCEDCAHTLIAYNSCRNRHCPKCQGAAAKEWLAEREAELLPVPYFHVVFTLPGPIADIAYQNKAVIYDLLFKAAAEATLTSPPIPSTWAPASASPPCSTPGARHSPIIGTCTWSCRGVASRWMATAGSLAGRPSFSPFACCLAYHGHVSCRDECGQRAVAACCPLRVLCGLKNGFGVLRGSTSSAVSPAIGRLSKSTDKLCQNRPTVR